MTGLGRFVATHKLTSVDDVHLIFQVDNRFQHAHCDPTYVSFIYRPAEQCQLFQRHVHKLHTNGEGLFFRKRSIEF